MTPLEHFTQAWFARIAGHVIAIKGPRYPRLFMERSRRTMRVIPLVRGWRITIRRAG